MVGNLLIKRGVISYDIYKMKFTFLGS